MEQPVEVSKKAKVTVTQLPTRDTKRFFVSPSKWGRAQNDITLCHTEQAVKQPDEVSKKVNAVALQLPTRDTERFFVCFANFRMTMVYEIDSSFAVANLERQS